VFTKSRMKTTDGNEKFYLFRLMIQMQCPQMYPYFTLCWGEGVKLLGGGGEPLGDTGAHFF
jgi:hypothetical protein